MRASQADRWALLALVLGLSAVGLARDLGSSPGARSAVEAQPVARNLLPGERVVRWHCGGRVETAVVEGAELQARTRALCGVRAPDLHGAGLFVDLTHGGAGWQVGTLPAAVVAALKIRLPLSALSAALLQEVRGVGPHLAARVLQAKLSGYAELESVRGIGPKVAARIRARWAPRPAITAAAESPRGAPRP